MFRFKTEQKVLEIGDVKVGGDNPVVLIGTVFYKEEKNRDNLGEIKKEIEKTIELSKKFNIPFMIDLYISENDNYKERIDFISGFDIPFTIDAEDWEVRINSLKYCKEKNILDRVIYNSVNYGMKEEEREALKDIKPINAIVLGFNPLDNSVSGKVNYIKNRLVQFAKVSGVRNILIDTGAMAIGSGSINSIKSVIAIKSEIGLPTGNGIHNVASGWSKSSDFDKEIRAICDSSLAACQALLSADFLMYGPIESSYRVFPIIKMIEEIKRDG